MERRLYFLIPDRAHAIAVVDDLVQHGIGIDRIQAVGDRYTRMDGLPGASGRGDRASASRLQQLIWNVNTLSFATALVATVLAPVFIGLSWWLLLPVVIMTANFLTGLYLNNASSKELNVFRDAVSHGEILLVVDIPEIRAVEVDREIRHNHPEATSSTQPAWDAQAVGM